jgi:hypothetical protein
MAYNASFPEIHALKANFYLAQAYFAEDKSIANYVINEPRNEFTRAVIG